MTTASFRHSEKKRFNNNEASGFFDVDDEKEAAMRVVFIGVSHLHTQFYLEPALHLPDVQVVGVSDPDARVAQQTALPLQCVWATDFRKLCEQVQPDFAFVLGQHADMAAACHYLIDQGIAFCVEKPAGISAREVNALTHCSIESLFSLVQ